MADGLAGAFDCTSMPSSDAYAGLGKAVFRKRYNI